MADGITALRQKKRERTSRQAPPPRHPTGRDIVAEFVAGQAVTAVAHIDEQDPPAPPAPAAIPAEPTSDPVESALDEAGSVVDGSQTQAPDPAAKPVRAAAGRRSKRPLPDLTIDWTDPLMHVATPTRVSVANSVVRQFKDVADQPGSPPQTELILSAVNDQLHRLPELVLSRRPEEQQQTGFFLRRATVQKPEPWLPLYMRPIAGEVEALKRIVDWVTEVITDGHPGRRRSNRSEVVTAALAATYSPPAPTAV
ncbi:hypothetical protein C1Y40_04972 [Mycobacterium talmoniae]|uniref:Uncharacterized protein n=1 Tax=Mycobacterium talmoniae TaxID=1858794 RepID=A0A2S8BDY0_9MYCO|nr:hypothetical protein [Mycobacterium eburneum]PQM44870.1 hypothetical protein C1Y40_04972 [Mycobacterium talmoniae]TDH46671.1 hypothetical protein E2F47_27125 [Mycobacterium eburneum]